eukprot:scaffold116_cov334-Pavlova_lutheri.AAC.16
MLTSGWPIARVEKGGRKSKRGGLGRGDSTANHPNKAGLGGPETPFAGTGRGRHREREMHVKRLKKDRFLAPASRRKRPIGRGSGTGPRGSIQTPGNVLRTSIRSATRTLASRVEGRPKEAERTPGFGRKGNRTMLAAPKTVELKENPSKLLPSELIDKCVGSRIWVRFTRLRCVEMRLEGT